MTQTTSQGPAGAPAEFTVPTAAFQTSVSADKVLHSGNAGVIVERVGQVKAEFRSEGREFGREVAEYLNTNYVGTATVFVYEETFGKKDQVHWLMHIRSLNDYEKLLAMGAKDEGYRNIFTRERVAPEKGGGAWDRLFIDGSLHETVLLPHFWGMYGARTDGMPGREPPPVSVDDPALIIPPAEQQSALPPEQLLNSATCGILLHRTGQIRQDKRGEGRTFARSVAELINHKQNGLVSVYVYEEAFGQADRIHWLIHMKSLGAYYSLVQMHAWMDAEAKEVHDKDGKVGAAWDQLFVDGTLHDVSLTPQFWGMYATQGPAASGS